MLKAKVAGVVFLILAGCATGSSGPAREMPDYFYNALLSSELARTVARECGSGLAYNEDEWKARLPQIAERMSADGYGPAETQGLLTNFPKERLQADTAAYIETNDLVAGQASTFCATGRSEVAANSEIGSFLRTAS